MSTDAPRPVPLVSASLAVASVTFLDGLRRGSTIALIALMTALMLSLRWIVVFGFGEETRFLQELGLSNLLLGGALLSALCAAPVTKSAAIRAADLAVLVRPTHALALPLGRWLGIMGVVACAYVIWLGTLMFALAWFADAERTIFLYHGPTTVAAELSRMVLPSALVFCHSMLMCAVAVFASTRAAFIPTLVSVAVAMVVGVIVPGWLAVSLAGGSLEWLSSVAGMLIPDLRLLIPGNTLFPDRLPTAWITGSIMQALAITGLLLLAAAWRLRPRR